jgi:TPP-dependent indolepyruvate ferredoxin oxidoreductase alpha subunit
MTMVEKAFELSEASNTPVMVEVRIRGCHVHGRFKTKDNRKPAYTLKQALENPVRDVNRIVLPPASFIHEKHKVEKRWPAAVNFIRDNLWTWAGTGIALVSMSGVVQSQALAISGAAVLIQCLLALILKDKE